MTQKLTDQEMDAIVRPLPKAKYLVDHMLPYLEKALQCYDRDWTLEMEPDFQRGHVWTEQQQVAFMEAFIRGSLPDTLRTFQFNHPQWDDRDAYTDLPERLQCVDGLQRLTACRRFLRGEIKPYGLSYEQFMGTRYSPQRMNVKFAILSLKTREELLNYYLDINSAGTPHTQEELDRVKALLKKANSPAP